MAARRAYGTGTVYQRKSDGRWIGSLPDGHGGVLGYRTGLTRAEAEAKLAQLAKAGRSSTSPRKAPGESLERYLERWLDDAATTTLRPRTVAFYRSTIARHIVPAIGRIRLRDLEAPDVARMVTGLLKAGYSPQTAKHAHKITRSALAQAERWGLVERNVAQLVKSPRVVRAPLHAMDVAEARRFLELTRDHPRWPLYVLAITTGMRRGELLGLRWADVDLARGELTVSHTLRQVSPTRFAFDEPKTERSRRTLPLTGLALEALRQQLAASTSAVVVFARPDGRPLPAAEVTREFQAQLAAHGFRRIRFHDLRHTAAQLLLDATGGDLRAVMAQLGHSTIATTVDTYGGVADDARRRSRDAMDKLMEALG